MKCLLFSVLAVFVLVSSCKNKGCIDEAALNYDEDAKKDDGSCTYPADAGGVIIDPPIGPGTEVLGYNIMSQLPGIWNGPVTSSTALAGYPEWIVDFRPISPAQISAKNELDSVNDIFMSFFVAKMGDEHRVFMRNGGGFAGSVRTSYMICDSVDENTSFNYYRFVDPAGGKTRVHTEVRFKEDSLIMHTFTNDYNTLSEPVSHMKWTADLRDETATQNAIANFNYPQKQEVKDFTTTFDGQAEAVYYGNVLDPYKESEQPYLGNCDLTINIANPAVVNNTKKVLVIITTEALFPGMVFQAGNLDFRSRYVFVNAETICGYDFNYMHPGNYYINCIYDENGDYNFTSGDYMNSSFDSQMTVAAEQSTAKSVTIDFLIP
ncbi:MAG: hypothetical protein ACI857_002981 [Arenicella sp.]|jgi:hypothetical protein